MIQFIQKHLTVFQSALFKTTCTVVENDDFLLIVDPNWLPQEIEAIQHHVETVRGKRELYLLFTHGDFDHIIGYRAFPDAKIIGSKGLQHHPKKENTLGQIRKFDNDYYIDRPYPIEFPVCDIVIEDDGQLFTSGNMTLTFYLAPGHSHDGIFTVIEPQGILIAGDYLSDFELPFIYDSAKSYLKTLQTAKEILLRHHIKVLVPGHGKATDQLHEMRTRFESSQKYLDKLISAVMREDAQELDLLAKEMPYPSSFTAECHAENIAIIKKEYITK
ncbi:MBL fold metallo-hydrolase [Peribacillus cavernae]|uniref:MBL fold metallo-hydrolase n=1 Tax=Peribacillus cavernae TaxID=1674310 RepID=A0A3S0VH13_9BACI|nr:MBL fold metallo-hydrolase [Peribacillus cavernae]MDQ0219292.1 glyoxylase-like metal-dependent hydrolase (beta-lactamase superfamily II) [Peribacillus cavernae]RUQ27823.1 MBL fold metallo-hydrolase [Peribacillus cavernae]